MNQKQRPIPETNKIHESVISISLVTIATLLLYATNSHLLSLKTGYCDGPDKFPKCPQDSSLHCSDVVRDKNVYFYEVIGFLCGENSDFCF